MTPKKLSLYALIAVITLIFPACSKSEPENEDLKETIVVDGWIESGKNPMVFVTTAIPASNKEQSISDLVNHLVRYAKVTIEHDGVEYPLVACLSDYYYIKTYFTTTDLTGEVGGEYHLTVEYDGMIAQSTTTIPEPALLDSLWSYSRSDDPTFRYVRCSFHDDPDERNFYRFFSCITNRQNHYNPAFLGLMDDSAATETISIDVDPGSELPNIGDYVSYYPGDIVAVKFATMTEEVYNFWGKADQNNILAFLPINVAGVNLNSNIDGGFGCWAGYGITEYTICVK